MKSLSLCVCCNLRFFLLYVLVANLCVHVGACETLPVKLLWKSKERN